jgi:O-acetyl-ADP-ribose deacetylase (regulator of RNase III)
VVYDGICGLEVDAIVNPAHADLLGGGGLDGLIHDGAGPELLDACRRLAGCEVGHAKTTPAFRLPARWIIHTVGPIWSGGSKNEESLLASCYRESLREALRVGAQSVAFPGISTGLHRFPLQLAAQIAVREVQSFTEHFETPARVTFVCFDNSSWAAYNSLIPNGN